VSRTPEEVEGPKVAIGPLIFLPVELEPTSPPLDSQLAPSLAGLVDRGDCHLLGCSAASDLNSWALAFGPPSPTKEVWMPPGCCVEEPQDPVRTSIPARLAQTPRKQSVPKSWTYIQMTLV
jgi:hypothetical protein